MAGHRVFIGISSNIDPENNIRAALALLAEAVQIRGLSTFYQTDPIGGTEQPPFINGVALVEAEQAARPLKYDVLRSIERRLGRVRTAVRDAPRPIDLDILLYDNDIIREPGLTVPDPDIWERPFLAVALLELEPDLAPADRQSPLAHAGHLDARTGLAPLHKLSGELKKGFCHE